MRDNLIIRKAEEKDLPPIDKLLYEVHQVHAEARPDLFVKGQKKYTTEQVKKIISDEKTPVFVAESEGAVIGYAFCIRQKIVGDPSRTEIDTLYIDDLCVDESCRGKHIGKHLYEYVVNYARSHGFYNVTLNVWADNASAVKFYEKIGLKIQKIGMEIIL